MVLANAPKNLEILGSTFGDLNEKWKKKGKRSKGRFARAPLALLGEVSSPGLEDMGLLQGPILGIGFASIYSQKGGLSIVNYGYLRPELSNFSAWSIPTTPASHANLQQPLDISNHLAGKQGQWGQDVHRFSIGEGGVAVKAQTQCLALLKKTSATLT